LQQAKTIQEDWDTEERNRQHLLLHYSKNTELAVFGGGDVLQPLEVLHAPGASTVISIATLVAEELGGAFAGRLILSAHENTGQFVAVMVSPLTPIHAWLALVKLGKVNRQESHLTVNAESMSCHD